MSRSGCRATLWQAMEFLSFVENHERYYRIGDFNLSPGKNSSGDSPMHSCKVTVEAFVYKQNAHLEERFGVITVKRGHLEPGYKFRGRKGRRDIFVDPRPITETSGK